MIYKKLKRSHCNDKLYILFSFPHSLIFYFVDAVKIVSTPQRRTSRRYVCCLCNSNGTFEDVIRGPIRFVDFVAPYSTYYKMIDSFFGYLTALNVGKAYK